MFHREQDRQDMEEIKDYRHTETREGLYDSEKLQPNTPPVSYLQAIRNIDLKQGIIIAWATPNKGEIRLSPREVMYQSTA